MSEKTMTKQEEIRAKQRKIQTELGKVRLGARAHNGINYPTFLSPDDVDKILSCLHDNDVVIKVEDSSYVAPCLKDSWEEIKQDMKESGYEKVESLKKEGT